ncbi:LAFA_0G00848g1_1 [Lachancea sp. 'fantastica']|nr:LAFA_0G00848g1_1 [Lachancea sp. 'fantastica']
MLNAKCSKHLESFLASKATFEIIYGHRQFSKIDRLLVLDSSFNPPHNGHLNLIRRAVQHYSDSKLHVILLLSLNNADKEPQPATFDRRLDMMCLLSDFLKDSSIMTSVGVTTYGKFVKKSEAMLEKLGNGFQIAYLVGFDTITRIFDPKYYAPRLVSEALGPFMENTELYCLTRCGNSEINDQLSYRKSIAEGLHEPEIPRSWHQKIVIEQNVPNFSQISSTLAREMIISAQPDAASLMPKAIYDYAIQRHDGVNIFEKKK